MPEDRKESLEKRRRRLEAGLNSLRARDRKKETDEKRSEESRKGYAMAVKLSSEFIAAIIVGVGLGWFIDWYFSSSPWGMIVFLFLGFGAGVLNVLRSAGMVDRSGPAERPKDDKDTGGA